MHDTTKVDHVFHWSTVTMFLSGFAMRSFYIGCSDAKTVFDVVWWRRIMNGSNVGLELVSLDLDTDISEGKETDLEQSGRV